ncbi:copper amine oxidase N-terminal domain-containing protein [Paenibacillus guangzhouensis]|uniref:copper amine oxidase N-terminal domain-containing protein n=1 Tax=Paenibacillus guangzhouensis TaxID=1473112 RepID=UPI00187B8A2C|nr:copper amine oxidase N-terminal domain-containing protein [Paenibacillus guangzhouensis]
MRNIKMSIIVMGAIMLAAIFMLLIPSTAESKEKQIEVYTDQQPVAFSVAPLTYNGTTLVQLRPLFEALGIDIAWDPQTETISGKKGNQTFSLKLNSKTVQINGKPVALTTPGTTVKGHTLVPLRFVGEATGAVVGWNSTQQVISIYSEEFMKVKGLTRADAQVEANKGVPVAGQRAAARDFYAHWEMDVGGLRGCPNLCWDYYYFVNDKQVATTLPDGGIDALDCNRDACLSYEIKGNTIALSNGKSYSYKVVSDTELEIDGDKYTKYAPASGLKLQGKYESFSYSSSAGSGLASSLTYVFAKDGYFADSSFNGFTSDGSDSGDKSGISTRVMSESNASGTYTISDYTLLLNYKDGITKKLLFFLPEQPKVNMLRIGGRDFLLKEDQDSGTKKPQEQPYSDLLTTQNIAEKQVLFTFEPKRSDQVSNIKITLEGYQWAKLKIDAAHSSSFSGFGDQGVVALTAKYRIQNDSSELLKLSDLAVLLSLPQSSATVKATQTLAPKTSEVLQAGESVETMAVLLVPANHFDKNKDFELRFGPLLDMEGQDLFQGERIAFHIWKNL